MISVIVPVYNAEKYIDACLNSILNQTYRDFEIVLIDDGSTDNSGNIVDKYASEETCIRPFHIENRGAAVARNFGIKNSKGDFVCFIDSDDIVAPDYLEYLNSLILKYDASIAICGYSNVYSESDIVSCKDERENFAMTGPEAMVDLLYQRHFMSVPWGCISKIELWDNVSFPEGANAEDMGTIYKLYYKADKVAYGDRKLYYYFQRKSNTVFSTSNVRNIDYYKHSRDIISFVKGNCIQYVNAAYSRHFSACFQILSETCIGKKGGKLVKQIYKDIRSIQCRVLCDKNGKTRNRCAAFLSLFSVRFMHLILRGYYKVKRCKAS